MFSARHSTRTLSLVVPIYNEALTARRALYAITAKTPPGWKFEIIIIESISTDGTRTIVERYRTHPSVTLVFEDRLMLKDPFAMYKVFRRKFLEGLTSSCNRFDFDWELLIKLVRKGFRPIEIPISYTSRSFAQGKKISMLRDPLTWIWPLLDPGSVDCDNICASNLAFRIREA